MIDAARKEEKVVRDFFNAKRREIDAIQITINKMKNATAISEINVTVSNIMELSILFNTFTTFFVFLKLIPLFSFR